MKRELSQGRGRTGRRLWLLSAAVMVAVLLGLFLAVSIVETIGMRPAGGVTIDPLAQATASPESCEDAAAPAARDTHGEAEQGPGLRTGSSDPPPPAGASNPPGEATESSDDGAAGHPERDAARAANPRSKVSPELLDLVDQSPDGSAPVRVILQAYVLWQHRQRAATMETHRATVLREFTSIDGFAVELPISQVLALAADENVHRISSDALVTVSSHVTVPTVGADQVWPSRLGSSGVDGKGVTVAVIDSGGRDELVDLRRANNSKRIKRKLDFTGSGGAGDDNFGHATHVTGIVGGDAEKSSGYSSRFFGIAPEVELITLKVLDDSGMGYVSNVIAAIDWCIQNRAANNIRVMNLSLGHPVFESCLTDPLTLACRRAADAGIVVVAAAGNYGSSNGRVVYGGITSPGNAPWVITVGSTDTEGTVVRSDDSISFFSSRGPTAIDGHIKPDLVAPGRRVVALLSPGCRIASNYPHLLVSGSEFGATGSKANETHYLRLSGTSMAAPVVAGAVALMLQKNPSLTPNGVKAILMYTAEKLTGPNVLEQGAGYLNVEGAVRLAGSVRSDSNQVPVGSRWLRQEATNLQPVSTIGGEAILWGSAIVWGNRPVEGTNVNVSSDRLWGNGIMWSQAIMWSQGGVWDDPLMTTKHAGYGAGTSFTDAAGSQAVLWANAIMWSQSTIQVGDSAIMWSQDAGPWEGNMVDPTSLGSSSVEEVVSEDESSAGSNYVIGPPDSWYYPRRPQ